MWYLVICVIAVLAAGYFGFRYAALVYAIGKVTKELDEAQEDFTQNQMLHLPVPSRSLGGLLNSCNRALKGLEQERLSYERREKEFKQQIEHISHDLRTPLTVLLGYLKLMEAGGFCADEEGVTEALRILKKKAEHMEHLVNQFYDFSRIQTGEYEMKLHEVDAGRILKEALLGNYQMLEQARLKVELKLSERPLRVLGDEGALERIFLNLLQNAGRYARTFLRVEARKEERQTVISFINDTEKLTGEDVSHLFERFYMQDASRTQGGTGLGLTVAKALAEGMGAALEAVILEEDFKQGAATVCFELTIRSAA